MPRLGFAGADWQIDSARRLARVTIHRHGRPTPPGGADCLDTNPYQRYAYCEEESGRQEEARARQVETSRPRGGEIRLPIRGREGRRQRLDEAAAGRQGRQSGGDEPHRAAGASGLHPHHRGLHALLCQQAYLSGDPRGAGEGGHGRHRETHGDEVRQHGGDAAARFRALRRPRLDARHDGHHPQSGAQRPDRAGTCDRHQERAFRLGLLPPLRPDVRRRGDGRAEARGRGPRALRDGDRVLQAGEIPQAFPRQRPLRRRPEGTGRPFQATDQGTHRQAVPAGPVEATVGLGRRGVRLVDE